MSNFSKRLRTFKTGLWVLLILRNTFQQLRILGGLYAFSHCPLFSHPKLVVLEKRTIVKGCCRFLIHLVPGTRPTIFYEQCSVVKMSRISGRSREVQNFIFSFLR